MENQNQNGGLAQISYAPITSRKAKPRCWDKELMALGLRLLIRQHFWFVPIPIQRHRQVDSWHVENN